MYNLLLYISFVFLISFPVVDSSKDEAILLAYLLIIITTLAFFLGISLLIYIPLRFLYWLITKKSISKVEKYYTIVSVIFTTLGLIIYYTL